MLSNDVPQFIQRDQPPAMQHAMAVGANDCQLVQGCDAPRLGQSDRIDVVDFHKAFAMAAIDQNEVEIAGFATKAATTGEDLCNLSLRKAGSPLAMLVSPELGSAFWRAEILVMVELGAAWIIPHFLNQHTDIVSSAAQAFGVASISVPDQLFSACSVGKPDPKDWVTFLVVANLVCVASVVTGEVGKLFPNAVWVSVSSGTVNGVDPAQLIQNFGQSNYLEIIAAGQVWVSTHVKLHREDMLVPSPFDVSCHFDTSETTFNRVSRASARGCVR